MHGGKIVGLETNWPHRGFLQYILVNRRQTKPETVKIKNRGLEGYLKDIYARNWLPNPVCGVCVCVYLREKDS